MKELTQIRSAVVAALQAGGLEAGEAFPARQARPTDAPVASVGVGAAESGAVGFCSYLGEEYDPETSAYRERYGKLLEADITVDIRAVGAQACQAGCETAAEVLLGDLPQGIRPGELRWEGLAWERATGMFLRRGVLRCRAVFVARASSGEEDGAFLDFILKGVMTT